MADNNIAQQGFRTYIGLRYVPIIVGTWDINEDYEALSIVISEGNSYTSKKPVPAGVALTNDEFWVMTGNYNAQVANLQNEVEVAVRQILDYATDFETFKNQMLQLYDDFVVDANGEVLAKVEEYEALVGEQYEAFIRYVNNALAQFREEMDSFTVDTNARIDLFETNFSNSVNNRISEFETDVNAEIGSFKTNTSTQINGMQTQLDNLILQAGNPESSSAEIEASRTDTVIDKEYATLNDRLDGLHSQFLGYRYFPTDGSTVNVNSLTDTGIYITRSTNDVINSPESDYSNARFSVVVRECTEIPYQYGTYLTQCNEVIFTLIDSTHKTAKSWKRYDFVQESLSSRFTPWVEIVDGDSSLKIATNPIANFNFAPVNSIYFSEGYPTGNKPSHLPDELLAETPYTVVTYGNYLHGETQFCYFGTNNRVYVRNYILAWTDWDYLTTKDDVDSACATLSGTLTGRINEKIGSAYIDYNDLHGETVTLADLKADIVTNVATYSEQIIRAKLTVGLDGVSTGVSQLVYVLVSQSTSYIFVTFIDFVGHTYYDVYTKFPDETWAGLATDYYTKAEVNALVE